MSRPVSIEITVLDSSPDKSKAIVKALKAEWPFDQCEESDPTDPQVIFCRGDGVEIIG